MDERTRQVAELLERAGWTREAAYTEAARVMKRLDEMQPGVRVGAQWAGDLPRLWQRAERSGARRLVLEIVAEGETREESHGRLSVSVIEREDWPSTSADEGFGPTGRERSARNAAELSRAAALTDGLSDGEADEIARATLIVGRIRREDYPDEHAYHNAVQLALLRADQDLN